MEELKEHYNLQKKQFQSMNPIPITQRVEALYKLKALIKKHSKEIESAVYQDLKRPSIETQIGEISTLTSEIDYTIKNIKKWTKIKKVKTSLINFPSKAHIHPSAKGVCLIIGTWNAPILQTLRLAISAIAAGNCVTIKPSEIAQNSSSLITRLINNNFPPKYIHVIEGDALISELLVKLDYDHVFFTGSACIGKRIMRLAADNLTPITLELGGKSPVIVDKDAPIHVAAQRIIWGKFINAGQNCIAPDYVIVHESIFGQFVTSLIEFIEKSYSTSPINSNDYSKIIDEENFDRLVELIEEHEVFYGGEHLKEEHLIAPTIILNPDIKSKLMTREIFGPILPVIKYSTEKELKEILENSPTPLALYLFTRSKNVSHNLIDTVQAGGVCINDTLLQISEHSLPFGGLKSSGMGKYHGKAGFDEFTHYKSVLRRGIRTYFEYRYPPYRSESLSKIKKMLRIPLA